MIGYHKDNWNCAHEAVDRINKLHGLSIRFDSGQEWQASFLPYLREYFKPVRFPVDKCLVVMTQQDGSLHLGTYESYGVRHNYKPIDSAGCVIISDMGTIRSEYKRVRYYVVNKEIL
ncbi:hypothetical protein [Vibrio phage LP.2]|nr:hypothetical protein [Vibrio phage LP.2]